MSGLLDLWAAEDGVLAAAGDRDFCGGAVRLHYGDSAEVLKGYPDCHFDSVVCDPPYALVSAVKRFGAANAVPAQHGADGAFARASRGFMGKQWDNGDVAHAAEFWAEVLRILKPGGHVAAFAGTRTYHRLAVAIEDAGFEVRDQLAWVYGTGFPKSLDISKAIDKAAGEEREIMGRKADPRYLSPATQTSGAPMGGVDPRPNSVENYARAGFVTAPATDLAKQWAGWGTALKPAWEPICLARRPLDGTNVENVLRHGVGGLNIDGCRVEGAFESGWSKSGSKESENGSMSGKNYAREAKPDNAAGRFPANLLHDGSDEVLAAFPGAGEKSASRFFFAVKASKADRAGSRHPTVKPVSLMRWLVRLVTPPGGLMLDPFAGSGTTGQAAREEGMRAVLVEREAEYAADIAERMRRCADVVS